MSPDNGEVYILQGTGEEEWVRPTPARTAIAEAVTAATDLTADDLNDIDVYVDLAALGAALDDGDAHTFTVEGHEVTVDPSGDIAVEDED